MRLVRSANLVRFYRAAVLAAIVALIYWQSAWLDARRHAHIGLEQARRYFPAAQRVDLRDVANGIHYAVDANGEMLGAMLTTSPHTDHVIGYSGPNNLLVAIGTNGAVEGIELLRSGDTEEHVELVQRDRSFLQAFVGWNPTHQAPPEFHAVSGATLTSYAIAEALQKRLAGGAPSLRFPEPVTLAELQSIWTNAAAFKIDNKRMQVSDAAGRLLGYAVRTSPQADNVSGYRGPSDALVALSVDGRTITRIRLRKSYDTASYADQIREDESYLKSFEGRRIDEVAALDYKKERIEGVSGATETSFAIAEGLKRRFAAETKRAQARSDWQPRARDWALALVLGGAMIMSFTRLRGVRVARIAWQCVLIGYVGLVSGDLLSIALYGGWAASGLAKVAPGVVLLGVAALLIPWSTRRQIYCHQICPHGAAQQWLGTLGQWIRSNAGFKPAVSPVSNRQSERTESEPNAPLTAESGKELGGFRRRLVHWFEYLPGLLLLVALLALLLNWPLNLALLEPFDAWVWRAASVVTVAIAVVGLVASMFIPQAYCRFGCPTGALLNFVRSTGSADRWVARDTWALAFLLIGVAVVAATRASARVTPDSAPLSLHGKTMGTTWSVKLRGHIADNAAIQSAIQAEFDSVEQLASHWRTDTPLARFNRDETGEAISLPVELIDLLRTSAGISRASGGAYDVTVAPLLRLWGFGPAPRRSSPPSEADIAAVTNAVGWQKIEIDERTIRKQHANLALDLSSIAPGWAVDRVTEMLTRRGLTNALVESGGEIRASGAWTIAIERPARSCILRNESIGTSGTYRQKWESGGRAYSHLIDPRTGRPVEHRTISVSVRRPDCATADAWAAALNVLGAESGLPLANDLGIAAEFVIEKGDGTLEVQRSDRWTM